MMVEYKFLKLFRHKCFLLFPVLCAFYSTLGQYKVDTAEIYSNSMRRNIRSVIIAPASKKTERLPVVYLLHGYSGAYNNWINKMPTLPALAERYRCIIVCPDGAYGSWYIHSPADSTNRYEEYVSDEVVRYVDSHYRSIKSSDARAITGLSMGGHGALMLAMRHQDVFGAAASMSGAVNLQPLAKKFGVSKAFGDSTQLASLITKYSVYEIADTFSNKKMPLMIDCGIDDMFIGDNRLLHDRLIKRKMDHTYIERNGGHSWAYWTNALEYHLLFFRKFFDATNPQRRP